MYNYYNKWAQCCTYLSNFISSTTQVVIVRMAGIRLLEQLIEVFVVLRDTLNLKHARQHSGQGGNSSVIM